MNEYQHDCSEFICLVKRIPQKYRKDKELDTIDLKLMNGKVGLYQWLKKKIEKIDFEMENI